LRFLQTLEAQTFQRRSLRMPDTRFHFALAVGVPNAARQCDRTVVPQQVPIERIDRRMYTSGTRTPSRRLSRTIVLIAPPSRRKAFSCNSAQIRTIERNVSNRTALRL
jgi:hypothetical protein